MTDDRLTPEERAVIEAAVRYADTGKGFRELDRAARAYRKATAPPEPFEAFVSYYHDGSYCVHRLPVAEFADRTYRCTVTPVERVR